MNKGNGFVSMNLLYPGILISDSFSYLRAFAYRWRRPGLDKVQQYYSRTLHEFPSLQVQGLDGHGRH